MNDIDDKLRRKGELCEAVWEGEGDDGDAIFYFLERDDY